MKKFLIAAAFIGMILPMNAQFTNVSTGNSGSKQNYDFPASYNRFSIGYNAEFLTGKRSGALNFDEDADNDEGITFNGFNLQWVHGWGLSKAYPMYLEAGLKLGLGFNSQDWDYVDGDVNIFTMSASVPLNYVYRINVGNNISVAPYTGFNLKVNIVGNMKAENDYDDESLNLFDKDDMGKDFTWSRFQAGWQIGCGVNINKVYLGLEYGLDFVSLYKKCNTSHFGLNLGLNF